MVSIILTDEKIQFFPISKCGKTSIINEFKRFKGIEGRIPDDWYCDDIKPDFFKFAVVRDPHLRVTSFYKNKILQDNIHQDLIDLGFKPNQPFSEVVELICNTPDEKATVHFRSQTSFINKDIDKIFMLDQIDAYWQFMCDTYGMQPLQKYNSTDNMDLYRLKTAKLISKRYRSDLQLIKHLQLLFYSC
jgi:hypothetical protein